MFLILSGEGKTDIGTSDDIPGPMTKFIDQWIARRSGYSLIDCGEIDIHRIVDMASLNKFKDRLDDVLDDFLTGPQFR